MINDNSLPPPTPPDSPLRILLLEDSVPDAELVERELRKTGTPFTLKRVETREDFIQSIEAFKPNLILLDYRLPAFDGLSALAIARKIRPDIPVIFVSGVIGEDVAIETLKKGARDYVLKDKLTRLTPAIERALRESEEICKRKHAEEMLRDSEERFRAVAEVAGDAIICMEPTGAICLWNRKSAEMFGYTAEEAIGKDLHTLIVPEKYRKAAYEGFEEFFQTGKGAVIGKTLERTAWRKGGAEFPIELSVSAMNVKGGWQAVGIIRDITERKKMDGELRQEIEFTKHLLMIAETAIHTTNIDKLMADVACCCGSILRADICLLYVREERALSFKPGQAWGLEKTMLPFFRTNTLNNDVSFVKRALDKNETVIEQVKAKGFAADENGNQVIQGMGTAYMAASPFQWIPDIETLVAIPLRGRDDSLGLLICIYRQKDALQRIPAGEFTERDMRIMQGISHQVSIVLDQAKLYRDAIDRTMELARTAETISVIGEIDRSILSTLDAHIILETATGLLGSVMPCDMASIGVVDRERSGFVLEAGFGFTSIRTGVYVPFESTSAIEVVATMRPQVISDMTAMGKPLPFEEKLICEGVHSLIRVPLVEKGEVTGTLCVGAKRRAAFTAEDLSTLGKIANQISVALSNASLVTDLKDLFMGTVKSLSSAIDAKSKWTAGHSERVARFALSIGIKMGLDEKELKDLEIAALLHDVGKIGTFESIIDKKEKLTDEEYAIVKQHTIKGVEILSPIKHLKNIIPGVKYHHEFYNGKGYPEGIKGGETLLMASILAVADSVDAMNADRPYRQGKSMEAVVNELRRCSGTQFDPRVVDAFLKSL